MARSNHSKGDPSPAVTNGYPCHENGISLCTHASKRKRLQKPKIIKEKDSAQIVVEKLLKSDHCNGVSKVQNKPCRRSERKTFPNSLWDNAVVNPFFERKRRKFAESPLKTTPITNGKTSHSEVNGTSNSNGSVDHDPDNKSEDEADSIKQDPLSESNGDMPSVTGSTSSISETLGIKDENKNEKPSPDRGRHVRLRRSSRKHSSSVSSISDIKYTIKHEFVENLVDPEPANSIDVQPKCESVEHIETTNVEDSSVVENNVADLHKEVKATKKLSRLNNDDRNIRKRRIVLGKEFLKKQATLKNIATPKLSPVKELVNKKISPPKTGKAVYQHVSGCKENFEAIDDEIDVKTPTMDQMKPVLSTELKPLDIVTNLSDEQLQPRNENCKPVIDGGNASESEEKVYVDALGRRGKKRGRRSRNKAPLEHSESEESSSTTLLSSEKIIDELCEKSKTPENEITVSKDVIMSKEALQLIDGSSFQRFYKMRTRRQNSSNEQSANSGQ